MKKHTIYILDMKLILSVFLSLFAVSVFAQLPASGRMARTVVPSDVKMREVKGIVIDASTKKPLIGISFKAYSNSRYAAMSTEDGSFIIKVPDYETTIVASAVGYDPILCPINFTTNSIKVSMYSDVFSSIYDTKLKATKESSILASSMNADISVDKTIQSGLNADVRSINRSGQQGLGNMYLMNGVNSLLANAQPLIVIDGVITEMQFDRTTAHDGFYNNLLANISQADIERVTVQKNGSALYGAKGGNGVILIDTKRNKSYATKIDVDIAGNYELMPALSPMMNGDDYRHYASELLGTTGTNRTDFKFLQPDKDYYYYNWFHNNTDWSKEVYRNSVSQIYGINVQGGDEIASYNLSVGYTDASSTMKNFDMSRFNLRLNSDINIVYNKLDVRFDASYSDVTRNMRDDGAPSDINNSTITSVGLLGLVKAPFLSPYQFNLNGTRSNFFSDADDYLLEVLGTSVSVANPVALLEYADGRNKNLFGNRMVNLAISPIYKINRYLTATEHFSYALVNTNSNYFTPLRGMPSLTVDAAQSDTRSSGGGGRVGVQQDLTDEVLVVENIVRAMASHSNTFSSDTRFDWNRTFKEHVIHANAGMRLLNYDYGMDMLQGYNTGNDKMPNLSSSLAYKTIAGINDQNISLTYYALGDYNYRGKYFLSGGLSMEASSRFGADVSSGVRLLGVPWGLFPSIEAAWVPTSETWFTPNNLVNFMKINAGYDISGNDDINSTASRSYFGSTHLLNNASGILLENIGNTELQWESTKRLTAGVDLNLLDNRVNLSYNLFSSTTDNLLSLKNLDYVGGVNQIWSNDGQLSNTGYDLSLKVKVLNSTAIKMEVGASVAHYKNEITKLPGSQTSFTNSIYGATILSQVGSPIGVFYGYKTDGVYSTTLQANTDSKYLLLKSGAKQYFKAGDMNFVTADNEVSDADRTEIGDPNPDYYGNIFANLNVKNVTLSAVFNYSVGNDIFNYQRMILESGNAFYNQTTAMKNRWTNEGQVTDIPIITYLDPMGNSRFSDRWIEDGSFLRLKTLTLSYIVPINGVYLQGLTVWASASNLWTLTKYLGSDPENSLSNSVLLQGIDRGLMPQGKSFSFGLKINI